MSDYVMAIAGGVLVGAAAVMLLWLNGRIAGISGIFNGAWNRDWRESGWRIAFVAGLIIGGLLYQAATGATLIDRLDYPPALTVAAGILVGFGTRLGSGCTSGHGICGISRLSPRSIFATGTFVFVGVLVATAMSRFAG